MTCPNCGADLKAARKLVATSAKELVESLRLDADLLNWCANNVPFEAPSLHVYLDEFKDRMRANGYMVGKNPVKDARAAFRTHMRNAVKFSKPKENKPPPQQTKLRPYKTE